MKRINPILRLFNFLLHIYPQNFKNEFGEEMLGVFEQNLMDSDNWIQRNTKLLGEIQGWFATTLQQDPCRYSLHPQAENHLSTILRCLRMLSSLIENSIQICGLTRGN